MTIDPTVSSPAAATTDDILAAPSRDRDLAAFQSIEAKIRAMPTNAVRYPNSDVERSAAAAIAAITYVRAKGRIERMRALVHAERFDPTTDAFLLTLAHAVLHLEDTSFNAASSETSAKVDPALVEEAGDRRERMIAVLRFWFRRDEALQETLKQIEQGSGHAETMKDLRRLAKLYDERASQIMVGIPDFFPEDADAARANAFAIEAALTAEEKARSTDLNDLRHRTWTLLADAYDTLQRTHAFVFYGDLDEVDGILPLRRAVHGKGGRTTGSASEPESPVDADPVSPMPNAPKGTFPTPIVTSNPIPEGFPGSSPFLPGT